jgi:hypothetical protein
MASVTLSLFDDAGAPFQFVSSTPITIANVKLYTDMIYLDTDERRRFAQTPHEYLIEQLQKHEDNVQPGNNNIALTLNHPVKELVWVIKEPDEGVDYFDNDKMSDLIHYQKLVINGADFQNGREGSYNRCVVPYSVHTGAALQGPTELNGSILPQHFGGMYCFSFSLRPDDTQCTGSINFSRIDEASLSIFVNSVHPGSKLVYFGRNWNILRIMSGMGGAEYAN